MLDRLLTHPAVRYGALILVSAGVGLWALLGGGWFAVILLALIWGPWIPLAIAQDRYGRGVSARALREDIRQLESEVQKLRRTEQWLRRQITVKSPLTCPVCLKDFKDQISLDQHIPARHPEWSDEV